MEIKRTGRTSIFTKEEDQFIKEHYQEMSFAEIARRLGYSSKQIQARGRKLGCRRLRCFDNRYFQNIDTAEKAYWLGLLYADGWVSLKKDGRGGEVSIELQRDDRYMLERLNSVFGNVFQVKDIDKEHVFIIQSYCDTHSSVLRMYSVPMAKDLISHGVVENKTYRKEHPKVPSNLFIDFFRGYFDGNGCIYNYKRKKDGRICYQMNITTPNYDFALYCKDMLLSLGIISSVYQENEWKNRVVITSEVMIKSLCSLMYYNPDAPKLFRKYEIYSSNLGPQVGKPA